MKSVKARKNEGSICPSLLSDFFGTERFFNTSLFEKELGHSLPDLILKKE